MLRYSEASGFWNTGVPAGSYHRADEDVSVPRQMLRNTSA